MVYKENITIQLEAMGFCVINDDQPYQRLHSALQYVRDNQIYLGIDRLSPVKCDNLFFTRSHVDVCQVLREVPEQQLKVLLLGDSTDFSKEQYKLMRDSITTKTHHHHQSGKDAGKRKERKRVEAGEEEGERGDRSGTLDDRPAVSSSVVLEAGDVIK